MIESCLFSTITIVRTHKQYMLTTYRREYVMK